MKRILIPIDFTPTSERAVQYAKEIFKDHPMEIFLLYVKDEHTKLDDEDITQHYHEMSFKLLSDSNFGHDFFIREGQLVEEIKSAIKTFNINLVVMGTKGHRADGLASNSTTLMNAAHIPVIVVPENAGKTQIKRIAYANDFQNVNDPAVFKTLWDIARTFGAEVHIVHINQNNDVVDNEEAIIEYYLEYIDHEYICISNADIEEALNNYIVEKKIDLLVVLPRKKANVAAGKEERSLVKNLTENANIPVLTLA